MYTPPHYHEPREDLALEIIRKYDFATLMSVTAAGPVITHLPLILETDSDGHHSLLGHLAKANPHWRQFDGKKEITVVFNGPHAYISPAWYVADPENVPTWNYAAVHVTGVVELIPAKDSYVVLEKIVNYYEARYKTGWSLPEEPTHELLQMPNAIVAFRVRVSKIEAKFKMSQKIDSTSHQNTIDGLKELGGDNQNEVAEYMKRIGRQPQR